MSQFLKDSQLFKGLTDTQLQLLSAISRETEAANGSRLFEQGTPAKHLYIVGRGRVALEMRLERPDGSVTHTATVAGAGPGDAFGWSAVVPPHVLTLSAYAQEPSTLVLVEGEKLRELLHRHTEVGYLVMVNLAKLLADRLAQTREAFVYEREWVFEEKRVQ